MWGLDTLGVQYDAATGTVALPMWAGVALAALVAILFILALVRTGIAGTMVFIALVGFGGWAVWSWTVYTRTAERRALESRLQAVEAVAQATNSPLACLDSNGPEAIDAACERVLFGSAESTAAASAYVNGQITLLSDAVRLAANDPDLAKAFEPMRQTLEHDRYGLVANALVQRRGCTADRCEVIVVFKNPARIRNNMRENAFAAVVTRAAAQWGQRPAPTAQATPPGGGQVAAGMPLPEGYNLPSASSIPAVSIMQAEPPTTPAPPAAAAAPRAAANPPPRRPPPPRRQPPPQQPQTQSENREPSGNNGPVPLLPPPPRVQ